MCGYALESAQYILKIEQNKYSRLENIAQEYYFLKLKNRILRHSHGMNRSGPERN